MLPTAKIKKITSVPTPVPQADDKYPSTTTEAELDIPLPGPPVTSILSMTTDEIKDNTAFASCSEGGVKRKREPEDNICRNVRRSERLMRKNFDQSGSVR